MKKLFRYCFPLFIAVMAVNSSYGNEINTIVASENNDNINVSVHQSTSLHISKGTETNLAYPNSTPQKNIYLSSEKNNTVLYIKKDTKIFIAKNTLTNACISYSKQIKKAVAQNTPKAKKATMISKEDTEIFNALPKNKQKAEAQFVISVTSSASTTLKINKNSIFLHKNVMACTIFRKRKTSKRSICNNKLRAFQKLKAYALFSRPPTELA